jgi:hypothetical protein
MNTARRFTVTLLLLSLLALPTATVLAKELGRLTISGPGIKGELTLDNPKDLLPLWEAGIIDTNAIVKAPADLGTPYTITTFMAVEDRADLLPFIRMDYYPAEPGQPGYMHITGRLDRGDTLSPADVWTTMNPGADKTLRLVLDGHGIQLASAVPAAPAAAAPAVEAAPAGPEAASVPVVPGTGPSPYLAWAAIALVIGAAALVSRRSIKRRQA